MTELRMKSWLLVTTPLLLLAGCQSDDRPTVPLTCSSFQRPALAPQVATAPTPASAATTAPAPIRQHGAAPLPGAVQQTGASLGGFKTLGGVVSEVNGNPIYANKVLRQLTPELAARAPEMDEQQFRALATQEINKRIEDLVKSELVFGAADR